MPGGVYDVGNTLVVGQRWRRCLLEERLDKLILICTSVGGRLRNGALARLTLFDRLIVQDEVLLRGQVQVRWGRQILG